MLLRKNQARTRYWVWMAASLKFLLPFSLLVAAGEWARSLLSHPATAQPAIASVLQQIEQPIAFQQVLSAAPAAVAAQHANLLPLALLVVWACGALVVAARWSRAWRHIRAAVRAASPRESMASLPVFSTNELIEPGVFGIFHPVLLLPEDILTRLTPSQVKAVIAHEMCHAMRRDNLTFALHMIVEVVFWFYPPVWWIGARLIEERERACDETVVQEGNAAEIYAESILNVCKLYVETSLGCAAGVTSADLKERILRIMIGYATHKLNLCKKLLLGSAGLVALTAPLALGLIDAKPVNTQSVPSTLPEFEVASIRPSGPTQRELNGLYTYPGGMVVCKGCTVQYLIMEALNVQPYQISGGPGWINLVRGQRYDIQAKPPASSLSARSDPALPKLPPNIEQRQMLLSLLIHRFQLQFQATTRQGRVFLLTRGSKPLKLDPPADKNAFPWAGGISGGWLGGGVRGENISMPQLAHRLSRFLHCPVFDRTGLKGSYDFEYRIGDEQNDNDIPGILRAAMKGIGLNLASGRGPVETIIVEHVDQPSAN
jgi:uncharacterized protein (TIGR03435 family)